MNRLTYSTLRTVSVLPMDRGTYNAYRGWDIPPNEDPSEPGYLTECDSEPSNHEKHKGFITWVPAKVFDLSYRVNTYVDRLIQERKELTAKLELLDSFVKFNPMYNKLTQQQQCLLNEQSVIMERYIEILRQRIEG